jgi:hypothetical protein
MRLIWLLAFIASALMTVLYLLVYYCFHYALTWRVIALLAVVASCSGLAKETYLKFSRRIPN